MKHPNLESPLRTTILYLLFGGLWILLSDQLLSLFVFYNWQQSAYQTFKGWFFILVSGILLYLVLRKDFEKRKQAEGAQQIERAHWQGIVEGIADEVWMCNAQGKMSLLNLDVVTAMRLDIFKDRSVEEVYQEVEIFYPDGQPRSPGQAPLLRSLRGEIVRGEEIMRHRQTGVSRYRQFSSAPTRDVNGTITGAVAIVRDITDQKVAEEGLRRYELLSQHSRDIILFMGRDDGRILEANTAATQAYGYSWEEMLALTIRDLRAPDTLGLTAEQMAQADAGGILVETLHRRRDGTIFPVEVSSQGATIRGVRTLVSIVRDITERKRAEAALRESEARYRGLIESQHDLIVRVDPGGRFTFANDAYCQKFGLKREEILGQASFQPLVHPEDLPHTLEAMKALYQPPYRAIMEQRAFAVEGIRWIEWQDSVIRDEAGKIVEIQAIGRDITERKQAQAALRKSEQKFSVIFEKSAFAGALSRLSNGVIININEEFERVFGYTKDEVIGRTSLELGINPDSEGRARLTAELQARGSVRNQELTLVTKSGLPRVFLLNIDLVEIGEEKYILQTAQDITERKQVEEALRESENKFSILFGKAAIPAALTRLSDHTVIDVNEAWLQLFGYEREDVIGKTSIEIGVNRDVEHRAGMIDEILQHNQLRELEHMLFTKSGEPRTVLINVNVITIGGQDYAIASLQDITERKQAEQELHRTNKLLQVQSEELQAQSEELQQQAEELTATNEQLRRSQETYSILFHKSPFAMSLSRMPNIAIVDVNDAFLKLFGYTREELIGKTSVDLGIADPESRAQIAAELQGHGFVHDFEAARITKTGNRRFLSLNVDWVHIGGEKHILTTVGDITERKQAEENLRRFELLAAHSRDIILFMGRDDGRLLEVNAAAIRAYGYSREELLALTIRDLRAPNTLGLTAEQMAQADAGGILFETIHRRKDGSTFPVEVSSQGANVGGVHTLISIVRDITERKQAERQLRYQAALLSNVNDAIVASDAQFRITAWNSGAESLYGWKEEEVIGRNGVEIVRTQWPEKDAAEMRRVIAETDRWRGEATQARKDGTRFPVEVSSIVLHDNNGQISGYISVNRDITDRKQAEAEISDLAKFPTENPNPILRVQNDGKVTYANAASQELLEVWSCHVEEYLPEELRDFVTVAVEDHSNKTVDVLCKDKVYSIMIVPIVEGGYVNIYGRDITERKRAEEALKHLTEDLRRSNAELEQFAYVASHDLQEPLRMVSSYMQLLKRRYQGKLDNDADEFIAYAVDGAARMQNLINDLLAFSRVGTRGRLMGLSSCEKALAEALINLQVAIEESNASVTHDPLPTVFCDQPQLVQVFQNLIGNSIKFRGPQTPQIHISARCEEDEWIFSIGDNGIGLDPKFGERIFEIFQRLHSRTAYPGTGIGLAICKRIIQRHGGRIWVESKPGEGATFYFTLPIKETL